MSLRRYIFVTKRVNPCVLVAINSFYKCMYNNRLCRGSIQPNTKVCKYSFRTISLLCYDLTDAPDATAALQPTDDRARYRPYS